MPNEPGTPTIPETPPVAPATPAAEPTPPAQPAEPGAVTTASPPAGSPTEPSAPEEETLPPEIDWGELDSEMDTEDALAKAEPEPSPEPAPVPPQEVAPPAAPEPAAAPVPEPAVPATPQAPEAPPPEAPAAEPVTQDAMNKWREQALSQYAQAYAMTEDEGVQLINAPHEVLPQMAGRVVADAVETVYNTMAAVLPGLIEQGIKTYSTKRKAEKSFLEMWPKLREKPEYTQTYQRIAEMYKQRNPSVDFSKFVQEVGASSYLALGLKPDVPGGNGTVAAPAAAEPFVPAQPGAGSSPKPTPGSKNAFEAFNDDIDREEAESFLD